MKAIIGGTGIDEILLESEPKFIKTQYGTARYYEEGNLIYLLRHGISHDVPPHLINYRANVEALNLLGVDEVISIYCVGSITDKYKVGTCTLMNDFIDFTTRANKTFSDEGNVFHVRLTDIFDCKLKKNIKLAAFDEGLAIADGGVYVCTEGPRFETSAEIKMYGILGGDFVGMTAIPEIPLLKEKKIKVASIAYSINWASGIEGASELKFLEDKEILKLSKQLILVSKKALSYN